MFRISTSQFLRGALQIADTFYCKANGILQNGKKGRINEINIEHKDIPRESYQVSSRALDIKLGLDISQNCYQKFVTFVTFVPIEQGTFVTFVTFVPIEKGTFVTFVPIEQGTKVTNVINFCF